MSVRKRRWKPARGPEREAWVVDYTDTQAIRRLKTFDRKKDADDYALTTGVQVRDGTHVADRASVTIKEAGEQWVTAAENAGLERSTLNQYKQHLDLHIEPFLGTLLLTKLTAPATRKFEDTLRKNGRSPAMVRKVMVSFGSLLAEAQEQGLIATNPVRDLRRRRKGKERKAERRQKGKLKIGVDIPTPGEVKALVGALAGRWRPLLLTAVFTGLRASELRGLRWQDVDLDKRELHVRQRADRFNDIGRPKTEAGERTVPIPPLVANTLREWRLACPRPRTGQKDSDENWLTEEMRPEQLVFPNGHGRIESLANIINRGLIPAMITAGVASDTGEKDDNGKPIMAAKYTGMHALRHFYASWCINRQTDGGLGLQSKSVQERLGHSSIVITMDIYGHLFPRGDDGQELAAAEAALLA